MNSAHENQIAVLIMRSVPTHMLPTVTQINRKRCEISVQKCSLSEMLVTLNEGQWLISSSSSSSSSRSQRILIIIVYQDELGRFPKFRLAAMRLCVQQGVRRTYSCWLVLEYGEPMTNMLHCLLDSSGGAVCGRGKSELPALVETEAVVSGFKAGKDDLVWSVEAVAAVPCSPAVIRTDLKMVHFSPVSLVDPRWPLSSQVDQQSHFTGYCSVEAPTVELTL